MRHAARRLRAAPGPRPGCGCGRLGLGLPPAAAPRPRPGPRPGAQPGVAGRTTTTTAAGAAAPAASSEAGEQQVQQQGAAAGEAKVKASQAYPFAEIEGRWQAHWERHETFRTPDEVDERKPKHYVLDMFPYPSGAGLHVGHPEGYTATDIMARYKRMRGFNVMHPMGWDAFGLPAEQYAMDTGTHPKVTTERNVGRFRAQLKALGFSYDWAREVSTTSPDYFKWTQWIFLQLLDRGLAYQAEVPVNWCPALGTVSVPRSCLALVPPQRAWGRRPRRPDPSPVPRLTPPGPRCAGPRCWRTRRSLTARASGADTPWCASP